MVQAVNMDRHLYFSAILLVIFISYVNAHPPYHSVGKPWPMPMNFTQDTGHKQMLTSTTFNFNLVSPGDCALLRNAFFRYRKIIFLAGYSQRQARFSKKNNNAAKHPKDTQLKFVPRNEQLTDMPMLLSLDVKSGVCGDQDYPFLEMDESYNLTIPSTGNATLTTMSVWGVMRGLETFSQLVFEANDGSLQVFAAKIVDKPRFAHRGIMLDTARHWQPMDVLKVNIEAMAYNKINVFHWHVVDEVAFPYESSSYPDLYRKGAYDLQHVYSQADVQEIIEFARQRGIRTVLEFDTPGHVLSWRHGVPGLVTECYDPKTGKPNGLWGPIDPTANVTWPFITDFFKELATKVKKDHYLHLGGDEVHFDCWQSNPNISAWMKQRGWTDYAKLESYYEQRLLDIVGGYGAGYVAWQEIFDNGLKIRDDTVIHVWKGDWGGEMKNATGKGYRVLLSAPWYLDYIGTGPQWRDYWNTEPIQYNDTAEHYALVMGGEACLWAEFVDGTNLTPRLWPRASAIAERLWSPRELRDINDANERIDEHRCRMNKRSIAAEPPNGPSYCDYEFDPVQKNSEFW